MEQEETCYQHKHHSNDSILVTSTFWSSEFSGVCAPSDVSLFLSSTNTGQIIILCTSIKRTEVYLIDISTDAGGEPGNANSYIRRTSGEAPNQGDISAVLPSRKVRGKNQPVGSAKCKYLPFPSGIITWRIS
jgi:hypothetical protein